MLMEIGVEGVFVFNVVHVPFGVIALEESVQRGEIAGGGEADDRRR
jgi:hypothetical protein